MNIRHIILTCFVFSMVACTTSQPTLYTWNNYSEATFNYVKTHKEEDKAALLKSYASIIKGQKGTRQTVPPGVYADYGYLLIQSGQEDQGKKMLEKEVELYPESKKFISNLLNALSK